MRTFSSNCLSDSSLNLYIFNYIYNVIRKEIKKEIFFFLMFYSKKLKLILIVNSEPKLIVIKLSVVK